MQKLFQPPCECMQPVANIMPNSFFFKREGPVVVFSMNLQVAYAKRATTLERNCLDVLDDIPRPDLSKELVAVGHIT